jgi:hypothetical protein
VFGDARAEGPGPTISIERGARPSYRAVFHDGLFEDFDLALPDRDAELAAQLRALVDERDLDDQRAPTEPFRRSSPAIEPRRRSPFVEWLYRVWVMFRGLFSRAAAPGPVDEQAEALRIERRMFLNSEIERLSNERANLEATREAEFVARLRVLVEARASEVAEIRIRFPTHAIGETTTLLDLRGPLASPERDTAWALIRSQVDASVLVLDGEIDERTRDLSRELSALGPYLFIAATGAARRSAELAGALALDPGRVLLVSPSVSSSSLTSLLVNARTSMAGVRSIAALRIAKNGIEERMARDEAPDREALDRLRAHGEHDSLEEMRRRIGAACAGRSIRVLEGTVAALENGLAVVKADAAKALEETKTRDELKASVQTTGASLRAVRETLASQVQGLVDEAVADLAPSLLRDLDRRVDLVTEAVSVEMPPRPEWPAAPRAEAPVTALVAHATLEAAEALRAELTWTDAWLRSFEKVKRRASSRLVEQLDAIVSAARAEILGAEPNMAAALAQALGNFVDVARERFGAWLDAVLAAESAARAKKRRERQRTWTAQRDAITECERRLGALGRRVAASSQELAAKLAPHEGHPVSSPPRL